MSIFKITHNLFHSYNSSDFFLKGVLKPFSKNIYEFQKTIFQTQKNKFSNNSEKTILPNVKPVEKNLQENQKELRPNFKIVFKIKWGSHLPPLEMDKNKQETEKNKEIKKNSKAPFQDHLEIAPIVEPSLLDDNDDGND